MHRLDSKALPPLHVNRAIPCECDSLLANAGFEAEADIGCGEWQIGNICAPHQASTLRTLLVKMAASNWNRVRKGVAVVFNVGFSRSVFKEIGFGLVYH